MVVYTQEIARRDVAWVLDPTDYCWFACKLNHQIPTDQTTVRVQAKALSERIDEAVIAPAWIAIVFPISHIIDDGDAVLLQLNMDFVFSAATRPSLCILCVFFVWVPI